MKSTINESDDDKITVIMMMVDNTCPGITFLASFSDYDRGLPIISDLLKTIEIWNLRKSVDNT